MRTSSILALIWLVFGTLALVAPVHAQTNSASTTSTNFSCTGPVHAKAIKLWEQVARPYFTRQIEQGLNKQGNVYVLYYTQEELQSFVEMTRRCKDTKQIGELTTMLNLSFASLQPLPHDQGTKGWVCTGGHTCTHENRLLGREVSLCSAQFLGLIGAVAIDIVENIPVSNRTAAEKSFIKQATSTMAIQVNHWLSTKYFSRVAKRMAMTPNDVKSGSSAYFFNDHDLWYMTILSDLAELHGAGATMTTPGNKAFHQLLSKKRKIASLFNLFLKRVTIIDTPNGPRAVLDQGYWRHYFDDRYAKYTGNTSPVTCKKNPLGKASRIFRVKAKISYIDPDAGWDISHARRLVPALATFVRNKSNLAKTFGYANPAFKPTTLQHAFANQIVEKIWNKNAEQPLFSNFWDGSNGWYRAGYENGTGQCRPGQGPYSLTRSFTTGGYLQWGRFNGTLRNLGERIHQLLHSNNAKANRFMAKYYPNIGSAGKKPSTRQKIARISLLSDLVTTE